MKHSGPSREKLLDLYRDCAQKLGRPPGQGKFCKVTGLSPGDVFYYWARFSDFTMEACGVRNEFTSALPEGSLFNEYARLCLHLKKIPTRAELRIANRELGIRTGSISGRFWNLADFDAAFRDWLVRESDGGREDLRPILDFPGWQRKGPKPFPFRERTIPEFLP